MAMAELTSELTRAPEISGTKNLLFARVREFLGIHEDTRGKEDEISPSEGGKRILAIPMSWGRGMGPLMDELEVAEIARSMGHEVGFLCRDRFRQITEELGYPTYGIVSPKSPDKLTRLFDTDFPSFQGLGDEQLVRQTMKDEMSAIKDFKPDIVLSWLQPTAYLSTRILGVPLASVGRWTGHPNFTSPMLDGGHFPTSATTPLFNTLLREHKLPEIKDFWELDFVRSDSIIVPGTPELEPKLKRLRNVHYVGYLSSGKSSKEKLPDKLTGWLTDQPTIFVYLSVKQFGPSDYVPILQKAFDGSEFKVVVAMGLEDVSPQLPAYSNQIQFYHFIPVDALLPKTDILISTGTRGMSWQAALNGVAHISFPSTDPERYFVAGMVEKAGAGITLPDSAFKPKKLLETARLVYQSGMKEKAKKLGNRLKSLGGPQKAAELLINSIS